MHYSREVRHLDSKEAPEMTKSFRNPITDQVDSFEALKDGTMEQQRTLSLCLSFRTFFGAICKSMILSGPDGILLFHTSKPLI